MSPSGGEKSRILAFFRRRHFVVSLVGGSLRKLNTGAQLQTFPHPTVSKSFLYSNAFMETSGAQSLTFKSVTDRQTENRQTAKKLNGFGLLAAGEIRAPSNLACDRGPRARSSTSKTFGGPTHSFAIRVR